MWTFTVAGWLWASSRSAILSVILRWFTPTTWEAVGSGMPICPRPCITLDICNAPYFCRMLRMIDWHWQTSGLKCWSGDGSYGAVVGFQQLAAWSAAYNGHEWANLHFQYWSKWNIVTSQYVVRETIPGTLWYRYSWCDESGRNTWHYFSRVPSTVSSRAPFLTLSYHLSIIFFFYHLLNKTCI